MKTTKRDFETFRAACLEWRKMLGLTEWTLYFAHDKLEGVYAQTCWNVESGIATITLSSTWDKYRPVNSEELGSVALHEVLHVLLAPFCDEAESRYATQKRLDAAEHAIIRRLETVLHGQKENGGSVSTKGQSA